MAGVVRRANSIRGRLQMKKNMFIVVLLVLFSTAVGAETMYVSDLAEITLRTGKGIDHKIIAMIKSGLKVEVLEPADQWTRIRLPSGQEGWVVSRFLTPKRPNSIELKELKEKHEALLALGNSPFKEIAKLQAENQRLNAELAFSEKALSELTKAHESLKSKSDNLLRTQTNHQNSAARLAEQKQKAEKLEAELSKLEIHQHIRWFLCGAGVLFVGFLMGFSARRQRRRSSLL